MVTKCHNFGIKKVIWSQSVTTLVYRRRYGHKVAKLWYSEGDMVTKCHNFGIQKVIWSQSVTTYVFRR